MANEGVGRDFGARGVFLAVLVGEDGAHTEGGGAFDVGVEAVADEGGLRAVDIEGKVLDRVKAAS